MSSTYPAVRFEGIVSPNKRPYMLGPTEDANLVGMRLYGVGPFHRELKPATKIRKKSHFVIRAGDVIYNKLFAWKGTFGIVPEELDGMFVSDKFPTYELDRDRVDERYLQWYFRHPPLWEQARQMSTGSAALSKLTLNPPRFLDLTIPLPVKSEQQRIVAKIEKAAEKLSEATSIRHSLESAPETLLLAELDAVLTKHSKAYGANPLVELVDQDRGISYGIVQTGKPFSGGVPTLRAGDLKPYRVDLSDVKLVDPDIESSFQRTRLRGNELLLRIRGGLGEVAVCPQEMLGGNVSREIAVIPLLEDMLPEYAMYMAAAPSSQQFLRAHVRGTSYVGINLKDVRRLLIPIPPLDVQQSALDSIRSYTNTLNELEAMQKKSFAAIEAVLPSILDQAFNAKL